MRRIRDYDQLVYCITKKQGLTDEEFFGYWENVHAPIGVRIPGLRKLVQSRRLTILGDKYEPDYDGMAELWFDSVQALLEARQSPEWQASAEDEANFIDHNKVAYFVSEEHVILDNSMKKNQAVTPWIARDDFLQELRDNPFASVAF